MVFTNGLTPQRIAALIHFMAFIQELKITLIMKGVVFLICIKTKSQLKIKKDFIPPGFTLRLTILKCLAHDNQTVTNWLNTSFN